MLRWACLQLPSPGQWTALVVNICCHSKTRSKVRKPAAWLLNAPNYRAEAAARRARSAARAAGYGHTNKAAALERNGRSLQHPPELSPGVSATTPQPPEPTAAGLSSQPPGRPSAARPCGPAHSFPPPPSHTRPAGGSAPLPPLAAPRPDPPFRASPVRSGPARAPRPAVPGPPASLCSTARRCEPPGLRGREGAGSGAASWRAPRRRCQPRPRPHARPGPGRRCRPRSAAARPAARPAAHRRLVDGRLPPWGVRL